MIDLLNLLLGALAGQFREATMIGQWVGPYSGTNSGVAVIEIDDGQKEPPYRPARSSRRSCRPEQHEW
jgi:hypothetical protein